jgi:methionyl-tRNA synthetase
MREMSLGRDAEFNVARVLNRYQADLVNDLGNLLHRLVSMIGRYHDNHLPRPGRQESADAALQAYCLAVVPQVLEQIEMLAVNEALAQVMAAVKRINRFD